MKISGFISGLKQKMRDRESQNTVRVAESLSSLKKERVRLEGQKKIYAARDKEKMRISKAKAELKAKRAQDSFLGKVKGFAKQVEKAKGKSKNKGGNPFLPSGSDSPFALKK
jgi:hypothetical protein